MSEVCSGEQTFARLRTGLRDDESILTLAYILDHAVFCALRKNHSSSKCPKYVRRTNIQGLKRKEEKAGTDSFTGKSVTTRSQVLLQHALKSAATINTWAWQTLSSLTLSENPDVLRLRTYGRLCVCGHTEK